MKKFLAAAILAGSTLIASAPAHAESGWYVIMGSFHWENTSAAQRRVNKIRNNCGLEARWDDAYYIEGLNPNVAFVYMGPYRSKSRANSVKNVARGCVSDSYIKYGERVLRGDPGI